MKSEGFLPMCFFGSKSNFGRIGFEKAAKAIPRYSVISSNLYEAIVIL